MNEIQDNAVCLVMQAATFGDKVVDNMWVERQSQRGCGFATHPRGGIFESDFFFI